MILALILALAVQDDGDALRLSVDDGFRVSSRDGAFELHVGGRFEEQVRQIFSRPDSTRTSPDTFFVREAFLEADGRVSRDFSFLVRGGFASSTTGTVAALDEAYLEWRRGAGFGLRLGQIRVPAGQENLTSTLFTDCIERSILNRFVPGLDVGLMASGEVGGGLLEYQVAVTNGRAANSVDDNDAKEALLRLASMPFSGEADSLFRQLRLGVSGSVTRQDEVDLATGFDLVSTELSVLFLDSTAGLLDGRQWRAGAELSWVVGPASLRGELLWRQDSVRDAADSIHERMATRAWYGQLTVIVFGADKVVETRITPARPLDLDEGHWGAVEAVFRVAGARVDGREYVAVGNTLGGQSNSLLEYTLGANWFPTRRVRIAANLILEDYGDPVRFSAGTTRSALYGFLLRFQVDF